MKSYPSIIYPPRGGVGLDLHTFVKLDGSNLRFEYSTKRGWYKFGTRRRLLDETDPLFKLAVSIFRETLADTCTKIFRDQRWKRGVVYCEYWGQQSLAGRHVDGDAMNLTVIDVAPYKKGMLPPTDFLKLFRELGPSYLGYLRWNYEFISRVHRGLVEEASFEGVVGKLQEGKKLHLYKTKSQAWKDEVLRRYPREGVKIVNS